MTSHFASLPILRDGSRDDGYRMDIVLWVLAWVFVPKSFRMKMHPVSLTQHIHIHTAPHVENRIRFVSWAPRRSAGGDAAFRHPSHPQRKKTGAVGFAPAMGGGMDSFIVSMSTAKRVVSFCSNHAAALPFGSLYVSFVVEVDTDDAVSRTVRGSLNFVEHSIIPFAGLAKDLKSALPAGEESNVSMDMPRMGLGAFGAGDGIIELLGSLP